MITGFKLLQSDDLADLLQFLNKEPARNVFFRSRIHDGVDEQSAPLWGWYEDGELRSALYVGPNLVPADLTDAAVEAFAHRLQEQGRTYASIVGERRDVEALWKLLNGHWPAARLIRTSQPYMVLEQKLQPTAPDVRSMTAADLDSYVRASAAMFTSEVDIDPSLLSGMGYRMRVQDTIRRGLAFGVTDAQGITRFKTDVGCVTDDYCQIQGVWVHPELRGLALSRQWLATAIALIQREWSPNVCLYVNDFNKPALALYRRLGFQPIAEYQTIFF